MRRLYNPQLQKLTARFSSSKANPQWPEHCAKNNTKLVGIGGYALKAMMMNRLSTCPDFAKSVYLFSTNSWLRNVHDDYLNNEWGQSASNFPEVVFKLAKKRYPNLDPSKKLTFEQVNQIQKDVDHFLENMGVNLITDKVLSMTEDPDNQDLLVHIEGKEDPVRIESSGNYHVLNTARTTRKLPLSPESSNCVQSADTLYAIPRNQVDEIVVIGSGRNLDWAVRDFPETKIIHARQINKENGMRDRNRPDLVEQNRNNYTEVLLNDIEISTDPGKVVIRGTDNEGSELTMLVPKGRIYSAMGTELDTELTKELPQTKVTCLDTVKTPTLMHEGGLNVTHHQPVGAKPPQEVKSRVTLRDTEVPHGGLLPSYFALMNATGKFSMEKNSVLVNLTAWKDNLINYFIDHKIISNHELFKESEAYKDFSERLDVLLLHFLHQSAATGQEYPTQEHVEQMVKVITKQTLGKESTLDFNVDPTEAVAAYFEAQKSAPKPTP